MIAARHGVAATARTIPWPALLAGAAACIVVLVVAPLVSEASLLARSPGLGALALCIGAAFLLDDAAAATVSATPRSLAQRRILRIALALPLLCAVWAATLWYATAAPSAPFGPDARGALSLQLAAMLTLTLAASAIALRAMPDEPVGWCGVIVPCAIVGVAPLLPERLALLAAPGSEAWDAAQQRWVVLLALGVIALVLASRDPAA